MVQKSALLNKYLDQYKRRPTSRVFAPLAETYRKLGMHDDALKVLKDGIRFNPTYPLGYIILAHCYFDLQNYEHAYDVIRPFVKTNLDNISLQKLFGQICEKIGHLEEALETYKYLLFVNPKDEYVAERVQTLEKEIYVDEKNLEPQDSYEGFDTDEEDWVQVSFAEKESSSEDVVISERKLNENSEDEWQMETAETFNEVSTEDENTLSISALEKFKEDLKNEEIELNEPDLDDVYYHQEFDNEEEEVLEEVDSEEPIITHTLVDLYLKQNHFDKAIEFLESILKLHPKDEATIKKLAEVRSLSEDEEKELPVEEHERLLSLVEKSQERERAQIDKVAKKLNLFLSKIQTEANLRG